MLYAMTSINNKVITRRCLSNCGSAAAVKGGPPYFDSRDSSGPLRAVGTSEAVMLVLFLRGFIVGSEPFCLEH